MSKVILISVDLAKRVFQVQGAHTDGSLVFLKLAVARAADRIRGTATQMPDRYEGMCDGAGLRSGA